MSDANIKSRIYWFIENPFTIATGFYSLAWGLTYAALRLKWGTSLGLLNPFLLAADFLIPLVLILALVGLIRKPLKSFRWFGLLFILFFVGVMANLFVFNVHLMNYGDVGTLSGMIGHNEVFPRWMLGTGILDFVISHVSFPFFGPGDDLLLVKTLSALVMCLSAVFLLILFPNRLSLLLAFSSPFWLLFSSGYDEYYPFIAPLFILFMLFISTKIDRRFSAILIGIFAAVVGTTYAGFIPLSLIILFVFAIWQGVKKGLVALLVWLITSLLLIILFNGTDLVGFWKSFVFNLNLIDPEISPGPFISGTAFYKPMYALGAENCDRMLLQFFWTGSFPYLLLVIGGTVYLFVQRKAGSSRNQMLFLGLFLAYQFLYFVFMVPRLGTVVDIDLFFTLYISLAFTAGWLLDRIAEHLEERTQKSLRLAGFSFCAGSTAMVTLYLLFLGLYALV